MLISRLLPIEVLRFAYIPFLLFFSSGQTYICYYGNAYQWRSHWISK